MEITPEIRALLDRIPAPQTLPQVPQTSLLGRAGKSLANLPGNIGEGFTQSIVNLFEMGNPEGPTTQVDIPQFFDIPKAQTMGETVVDVALGKGGLADILGQSLIPAGAVGKAGKALGIAEGPGLEAAKWAAGFGLPEVQREEATKADVGLATTLGAAQGGLSFLPRRARFVPNLLVSGLHGAYEAAVRGPEAGLIAFGADLIGGQIPGAMTRDTGAVTTAGALEMHKPTVPTGPIQSVTPMPTRMDREAMIKQSLQNQIDISSLERTQQEQRAWLESNYPESPVRSAADIANQPFAAPPRGEFATLQDLPQPQAGIIMPWEINRRPPTDVITGVEPRPNVELFLGTEPKSQPIVPVEQPRNVRSPQRQAAIQKQLRAVPKETPAAQMPAVEPKIPASLEEEAFNGTLLKRYSALPDNELRAVKADLDYEIANTLDEATRRAYDSARSAVDTVLSARGKSTSIIGEVPAAAETKSWKFQDRVVHRDTFGQEQHGTVLGMVGGRAKVKFDGESEVTLLAANNLEASSAPKIATLQNTPTESAEVREFAEALQEQAGQTVPVSEIDKEATRTGKKPKMALESRTIVSEAETDPQKIADALDMELGGSYSKDIGMVTWKDRTTGSNINLKEGATLAEVREKMLAMRKPFEQPMMTQEEVDKLIADLTHTQSLNTRVSVGPKVDPDIQVTAKVKTMVDKIIKTYQQATNKNLHFIFNSELPFTTQARTFGGKEIEINYEWMADLFSHWHLQTPEQKRQAFARFSRTLGHEAGHVALLMADAEDSRIIPRLVKEFKTLTPETRLKIIGEHNEKMGVKYNEETVGYHAGDPKIISDAYKLHRWDIDAKDFIGMQEFFAEMSSSYLFGQLQEKFLPREMRSLWQTIKDLFRKMVEKFQAVSFGGMEDEVEQQLAFRNFHEIVATINDIMPKRTAEEIDELARLSKDKVHFNFEHIKHKGRLIKDLEERYQQGYITQYDLPDLRKQYGKQAWFKEFEASINKDFEEIATLQNMHVKAEDTWPEDFQFMTRAEGYKPSPIVGNRAFIQNELVRTLGSAAIGGLVGGVAAPRLTDQQMTVAEGVIAGALLGAAGPTVLRRMIGSMPKASSVPSTHIPAREAFVKLFTEGGRIELGADAANGQGSAPAKFVRFLERNLNLNLPEEAFNALVTAEGPAAYAVQIASDAFSKARNFVTNSAIDAAVQDFLKGDISVIDLRRHLGPSQEAQEFGNFIVTGRESIALLQKMFISGLAEGPFKQKIVKSLDKGDYLTRMYRIFHDPDYKPTQDQIEAVAQKLMVKNPDYDITTSRSIVEDYLHKIETERAMYRGSVTDVGQKLDSIIFQRRNDDLDIAFRDMLGQYVNPKEQVMGTIRHLYTSAIASKFYDNIAGLTDKLGLKMAYGREEVSRIKESLQVAIRNGKATGKNIATLQKQLDTLQGYVPLDASAKYGKLKGQMVSRFVRDQLASFDSPWGLLDGSIMRGLAKFHNSIKIGRTALNPITVVRNIVSAPILMALSRANPRYVGRAFKAMRDRTSADFRELLEQSIYGVDQVRGEFLRSTEQILMGDFDHSTMEGVFKTGLNHVLEFYRAPDMIVRGSTYFSAKARFAKKWNLPETDQRVINAARDWTNRYTVNYANVAPLVKTLRQVPFTNLFISYTAEVTRIAKNLIADIFQHEDAGQRVFAAGAIGGLVSIAPLMEMASVNSLSPKDREEWERANKQMPDYARTRFKVITSKEGNRFKYLDITPMLQIDAIMQMFRAAGNQDWKAFAAVNPVFGWENTPIMNVVAEQITGRDLRRDRPIDQNIITRTQAVMKEVVPPIMPGGYEYKRITDAFTLNEKGERGITNLRSGKRTVPSEIVTSYLTGMKLTTVDSSNLARFAVSDAKRKIANEASYYRDIANTDLPLVVKQRAQKRYEAAVQAILLELQQSMSSN
jgi:hypothetical protein